jgi:hypothetical protein
MFGERTLARPDATSTTPNMPMNCHPDQGAMPPRTAAVRSTPRRFRNDNAKTSARPRNARPDRCEASLDDGDAACGTRA